MSIMKIQKKQGIYFQPCSLKKSSKLTVICIVKLQKLNNYSFLMFATRTNTTENKIVLRYENSGDKLNLLSIFNSAVSLNL
jgi:hypothetical protein